MLHMTVFLAFTAQEWTAAIFFGVILLAALVALLAASGMFERGVFVDEKSGTRIVAPLPGESLPLNETSAGDFSQMSGGLPVNHAQALHDHEISDETPLSAKERETRRRTRMIEVLHRAQQ
jgi:hypothetical protein